MKHKSSLLALGVVAVLFTPTLAGAHERGVFEIGGSYYQFIIGSQGEPVVVDDRSGLDMRIQKLPSATATSGTAVGGLEKTLKLEIKADGQKRTQDITSVYGQVGSYDSLFFPTKSTELTYRVFGTIENAPVDLSFTCHKGGHVMGGAPDLVIKDMGSGVKRHMQSGMFSCPMEKEALGFPVPSVTLADTDSRVSLIEKILARVAREFGFVEIALGLLVVAFAAVALQQKKKPLV